MLIMLIFLHAIISHWAHETKQLSLSYSSWTMREKSLFYCISEKKNSSFLRISSYGCLRMLLKLVKGERGTGNGERGTGG